MSTKLIKSGVLVGVDSIKTPDNFGALLAMPRIKKLAASIKAVTQIAAVVVEKTGDKSFRLWAGHDRLAATMLANRKTIRADIREGSEADFLLLQLAENDERRHVLTDEYNSAKQAELTHREGSTKVESVDPSTRDVGARRKEVAAARGVTPKAEKQAAYRERKNKKISATPGSPTASPVPSASEGAGPISDTSWHGAAGDPPTGNPEPPVKHPDASESTPLPEGFEAWGLPVAEHARINVVAAMESLGGWSKVVTRVLAELTVFAKDQPTAVRSAVVEKIRVAAQVLGNELRSAIPVMLCPYCKDRGDLRGSCYPCGQTGLAGRYGRDNVPKELLAQPALVAVAGQFMPFSAANGKPAKAEKSIKVRLPDGRVADLGDEAAVHELTVEREDEALY